MFMPNNAVYTPRWNVFVFIRLLEWYLMMFWLPSLHSIITP